MYVAATEAITGRDDYLIHYPPTALAEAEPEAPPRWFDHIEMMLFSDDPDAPVIDSYFQMHPEIGVIHGFTLVGHGDQQLNLRGCRRLEGDERVLAAATTVGPCRQTVVDPLKEWTLSVEDNGWCDFAIEAQCAELTPAELWPPMVHPARDEAQYHTWQNYMIQHVVTKSGTLRIGRREWDLTGWNGFRDHCWGYRLARTDGGPSAHTWLPAVFPSRQIILLHREEVDYASMYSHARVYEKGVPTFEASDISMNIETSEFGSGRLPRRVEWTLTGNGGEMHRLTTQTFSLSDGLVFAAGWTGENPDDYVGPLLIEGDTWGPERRREVATRAGLGGIVRYRLKFDLDGEAGHGLLACFLANGYMPGSTT